MCSGCTLFVVPSQCTYSSVAQPNRRYPPHTHSYVVLSTRLVLCSRFSTDNLFLKVRATSKAMVGICAPNLFSLQHATLLTFSMVLFFSPLVALGVFIPPPSPARSHGVIRCGAVRCDAPVWGVVVGFHALLVLLQPGAWGDHGSLSRVISRNAT